MAAKIFPMRFSVPQPDATVFDRYAFYDYGAPPDPAEVLAHAYGDVMGAMLDFKSQIRAAYTSMAAHEIHNLLAELTEECIEVQKQALDRAEQLNNSGSAA